MPKISHISDKQHNIKHHKNPDQRSCILVPSRALLSVLLLNVTTLRVCLLLHADNCLATPWQGVQLLTLKSTQGVVAPVDRRFGQLVNTPMFPSYMLIPFGFSLLI